MPAASGSIQCLDRAFDVLEVIRDGGECGVSAIARELGLHVATVSNVLRTLSARGVLTACDGRYSIGPVMAHLVGASPSMARLTTLAHEAVHAATDCTGESSLALILSGVEGRVLAYTPAKEALTVQFPVEALRDPLTLSTGRVLAAAQSDAKMALLLECHLANGSAQGRAKRRLALLAELAEIQQRGYAATNPEEASQIDAYAVPVRDHRAIVVAALGASSPRSRMNERRRENMLSALRDAAAKFSDGLGHSELSRE